VASPSSSPQRHSPLEDVVGIASGAILFSVGLALLQAGNVLTGGTVGVTLLIVKHFGGNFGAIYLATGIPFILLAWWQKGWAFAVRSVLTLALVSFLSDVTPRMYSLHIINPLLATVVANILLGVGMLVIFRHYSSLGGFSVVGFLAQEKFNLKAGYVQLAIDATIFLVAFTTYSARLVLISLTGAVVLNITIALNHRGDRYVARSGD